MPRGAGLATLVLLVALTAWVGLTMCVVDRAGPLVGGLRPVARLRGHRPARPARDAGAAAGADGRRRARRCSSASCSPGRCSARSIPSLFPDGARVARLRNPVGYWNSLALVAATAVPFGLWAACSARGSTLRSAPAGACSSTSPSSSSC